MKRKFALYLIVALLGILLASTLTGCGKDDEEKNASAATSEEADDEDTEEDASDEDEEDTGDDEEFDAEADGEDEELSDYDDFVQEQSGKPEFKDFDEIISSLKTGQGYAYIRLQGLDEDILAVTESLSGTSALDASLYCMEDGKCTFMSVVGGDSPESVLRLDDGILYTGDEECYETYFVSSEYKSLMMKDSVEEFTEDGTKEYIGFLRKTNDFDNDEDFTGGEKEFKSLLDERSQKPPIEFTKVP